MEDYRVKRKMQNIKLREVAEYVGCSISLISKHECGKANMDDIKVIKYKKFINNYQKR